MIARSLRILCALSLVLAPACKASRWYHARYFPAPSELELRAQAVPGSQVRALASVLGVARADEKAGRPKQVEVRLRLENLGTVPARLVEQDLSLLSADLVPFEPPRLEPTDLSVPPGGTLQFDVAFPAPVRELDWSALNLRFGVLFQDVPVVAGTTFTRQHDTYYAPHWRVGFGYGYHW
jgi:hypothetical protein